jgi:hypothetical protein
MQAEKGTGSVQHVMCDLCRYDQQPHPPTARYTLGVVRLIDFISSHHGMPSSSAYFIQVAVICSAESESLPGAVVSS